ncbi:hypothetical protein DWB90_00355 [Staphylococcus chromogenes]|nr:hypothetical protein DWB90_00355 [Staphylococcus chromogenes]
MKMKLSTIAKTSLALGILTTGVMTTHAQSVDANGFNKGLQLITDENKELVEYYKKPSFDFKNVNGFKDGDKFEFVDSKTNQFVKVDLLGKDKHNLKEGASTNQDVFVVKEIILDKQKPFQSEESQNLMDMIQLILPYIQHFL